MKTKVNKSDVVKTMTVMLRLVQRVLHGKSCIIDISQDFAPLLLPQLVFCLISSARLVTRLIEKFFNVVRLADNSSFVF